METKSVFRRLSRKMLEDFSLSAEISHHGSRGTYRENTLKKFLAEGRLPKRYDIGAGEIVGPVHNVSKQCDLIIFDSLNGISLIYDEDTQVYPIECVAGTIEVKSTINKDALIGSLENIKSVKKLAPREKTTKTLSGFVHINYQRPLPFGAVFGYRLAGNSLSSLEENLREWESHTPKEYWPNIVAILDEGLIQHYRGGLRVAHTNDNLTEAEYISSIQYGQDTLFQFYSILIDLCASTDLGPIMLSRYFYQAEQLGDYVVSNHDRILMDDHDGVFKLSEGFISKIVNHCRNQGPVSQEQLLRRRFGQIPKGIGDRDLNQEVYLYNPDGLKGLHEVENPVTMHDGKVLAADGVMEPCHYIIVNRETYYIPWIYITSEDIEEIPGRTKADL